MATSVDMSLDDIIKKNRGRGRGRGSAQRGRGTVRSFSAGRMTGKVHRGPLGVNARPSQFTISKPARRVRNLPWQHDLLEESIRAAGITGIEVGTKLCISNLDHKVSNDDIRELFAEIGDLKRYAVHYDRTGRPSGSAEVVYTRRSDAFAALKKYNNVLLDGKPMKIEIVGANEDLPISARVNVTGVNGRQKRTVVMTYCTGLAVSILCLRGACSQSKRGGLQTGSRGGRGGAGGRGGGVRGGGRGRGRGKKGAVEKSADDLDKELENYHAEAMQS
ncbi:unnamed protein product [Linum tenue]|uniref:RRM domain-containing protein n=1 Tax=Linum tenue TaxID=586396 RepID=A0AAV0S1R9_9ROSI|nr:unnamed protein product [Linum tenue]